MGDNTSKLIGRTTTPDAVFIFRFLWNPAEVGLKLLAIDLLWIDETFPGIDTANLGPLVWKWSNSVGVSVKVDNFLGGRLVRFVFNNPNEVTSSVDIDVFWLSDAVVLDDFSLKVVETFTFTVRLTG